MYKSLEKFLELTTSIDELVYYDLKNESPTQSVREEKDVIKKILAYKIDYRISKFDCDNSSNRCKLTGDIYVALWGWGTKYKYSICEHLNKKININWLRYGTDTLNSFNTIYTQTIKMNNGDVYKTNNIQVLQRFATLTHTFGNFTLVPFHLTDSDVKSFNQYRGYNSGRYFVYDFFDLSLKIIKENIGEESFSKYIDVFYLNMYVDENYQIKPLIKRHEKYLKQERMNLSNPNDFLPKTISETIEFLQNVNRNIEARGRIMVKKFIKP